MNVYNIHYTRNIIVMLYINQMNGNEKKTYEKCFHKRTINMSPVNVFKQKTIHYFSNNYKKNVIIIFFCRKTFTL